MIVFSSLIWHNHVGVLLMQLIVMIVLSRMIIGESISYESNGNLMKNKSKINLVAPTVGSSTSLTLTTYLTKKADLHYAVVLHNTTELPAKKIKYAAELCHYIGNDLTNMNKLSECHDIANAGTISIDKVQKIETQIDSLQPNTSYDVYFVAEALNSNGVFGPVSAVYGTKTYPIPPEIVDVNVMPLDGSASHAVLNITTSHAGHVYLALVPSRLRKYLVNDVKPSQIATEALQWGYNKYAIYMNSRLDVERDYKISLLVPNLLPGCEYDIYLVTESMYQSQIYSGSTAAYFHLPTAIKTHALPPHIAILSAKPANGSSTALDISFSLKYEAREHLSDELESYIISDSVYIHYTASLLSHSGSHMKNSSVSQTYESINGTWAIPVDDVVASELWVIKQLGELTPGSSYYITLHSETVDSHGLVSQSKSTISQFTHQVAPSINKLDLSPQNGSYSSLVLRIEMSHAGDVHYVIGETSQLSTFFRRFPHQNAKSLNLLMADILNEGYSASIGHFLGGRNTSILKKYIATYEIPNLLEDTKYSVVIMSETSHSNGVYSSIYDKVLEAKTHEKASDIVLKSIVPHHGSVSDALAIVEMNKPDDILHYCLVTEGSMSSKCNPVNKSNHEQADYAGKAETITFKVVNLSADTTYAISLFSTSSKQTDIRSLPTTSVTFRTHGVAARILTALAEPVAARTEAIDVNIIIDGAARKNLTPTIIYYIAHQSIDLEYNATEHELQEVKALSKLNITAALNYMPKHVADVVQNKRADLAYYNTLTDSDKLHGWDSNIPLKYLNRLRPTVSNSGIIEANHESTFRLQGLTENTNYTILLMTESSSNSGVYSPIHSIQVKTHAVAPIIYKATAVPSSGLTNSIFLSVNLSMPGTVHYFISDVEFADPLIIKTNITGIPQPYTQRGIFQVHASDLLWEIKNGTNESQPVHPATYVNNISITSLQEGTTYHVSLLTETTGSEGVYGAFPPPLLVTTHLPAPTFRDKLIDVHPVDGSSDSVELKFQLNRLGEVHYALFFRGCLNDHSLEFLRKQNISLSNPIESLTFDDSNSTHEKVWHKNISCLVQQPSVYDLEQLNGKLLKEANISVLGPNVVHNDTITVTREEVLHGKVIEKKLSGLNPNGLYDLCYITETSDSDGLFNWASVDYNCQRVKTHSDFTNQTMLMDSVAIEPVAGRTDAVHLSLTMSKLIDAPVNTSNENDVLKRLAKAVGRIPYFALVDGKYSGHGRFTSHSFGSSLDRNHHCKGPECLKKAQVGRGHVAACGALPSSLGNIVFENETFLIVNETIEGLIANRKYYFYATYETVSSQGVFTPVNPFKRIVDSVSMESESHEDTIEDDHDHRYRSHDHTRQAHKGRDENRAEKDDAIEVTTYEQAPKLIQFDAAPLYGYSNGLQVFLEVSCESCDKAIVYIDVFSTLDSDKLILNRTIETGMSDREKTALVQEDIISDYLEANTPYKIVFSTETYGSNGVRSIAMPFILVSTFPQAPKFRRIDVLPRKASTTEIVLEFELLQCADVHYVIGKSGNPEYNITTPYNITNKYPPAPKTIAERSRSMQREREEHERHNYRRYIPPIGDHDRHSSHSSTEDHKERAIRLRRTLKDISAGVTTIEFIEYLDPGQSYDVYVVAEITGDNGVFGQIQTFYNVTVFNNAPLLIGHSVYPTRSKLNELTVGFRMMDKGLLHILAVKTSRYKAIGNISVENATLYGNRLAYDYGAAAQITLMVNDTNPHSQHWRETNLQLPWVENNQNNYAVYLVTETIGSNGVYGTVAEHRNVKPHGLPPALDILQVIPTDARVDSLTATVALNRAGHVHYKLHPIMRRNVSNEDIIRGNITIGAAQQFNSSITADQHKMNQVIESFDIPGLTEGTKYRIYFRAETYESYGIVGDWKVYAHLPQTHGFPPEILDEWFECSIDCNALNREVCIMEPNICGDCSEGYTSTSDISNEKCQPEKNSMQSDIILSKSPSGKTANIKIKGIIMNQNISSSLKHSDLHHEIQVNQDNQAQNIQSTCPVQSEFLAPGRCN